MIARTIGSKILQRILRIGRYLPIGIKLLFEIVYMTRIAEAYSYLGSYAEPNYIKGIFSWLAFFGFYVAQRYMRAGDLKYCFDLLFTISVIPTLSIYWMKNCSTIAFLLIVLYWAIWLFATYVFSRSKGNQLRKPMEESYGIIPRGKNTVLRLLFLWLVISTIYFSYRYGEFRTFISFQDVYTYRLDMGNKMGTVEGYLFSWNTHVFLPLCLIIHLDSRKYLHAAVDVLLMLLSYSIYGNKIVFLSIIMVFCFWILRRFEVSKYAIEMVNAVIVVFLLILVILPANRFSLVPLSLVHRVFSVPAEAHYYYYDFFQNNELLYLRQSILRWLFESPYPQEVSKIIGSSTKYYITGSYNNANNGCFSDAYQNFGVLGVLIYPIVLVGTIDLIQRNLRPFATNIRFVFLSMMVLYLYSAYYFSWLLSGGAIIGVIVCKLMWPRTRRSVGRVNWSRGKPTSSKSFYGAGTRD